MSFNIVDLVKDQISDQLMGQMGSVLGIEGSQTTGALAGALPGLLGGLTGAARNPAGAGALFDAVSKQDDGMLGNLGNLLGGGQSSQVVNQGTDLLGSVLGGGALGKLADVVGSFSGIGRGSSSSMLGMLAPLVIGVIKKKLFSGGGTPDAGALASMLMGQQDNINAAMPQGFSSQLQSAGFFDSITPPSVGGAVSGAVDAAGNAVSGAAGAATATASRAADAVHNAADGAVDGVRDAAADVRSSGGGFMKWLLPLVIVGALGWLAMNFLGKKDVDVSGAVDSATSAATDAANTATQAVGDAANSATDAAGNAANAVAGAFNLDSAQSTLSGVFNNATSTLSGITDVDSAKAALPQLQGVQENLTGLTSMLQNVPADKVAPLAEVATNGMSRLQPLADKALALPGVGDILRPVVEPILSMLGGIGG